MPLIESAQNDTFKKLLSLTSAKGLKLEKLFLLSGEKLVREFLRMPNLKIVYELVVSGLPSVAQNAETLELSQELFGAVDVLGTYFNILVLEQPPLGKLESTDLANYVPKGIEVVMPIGDPGNLGALVRSCEAFGVPHVILTREAAHPFLPKTVRASAGSVLRVPLSCGPALRDFPASCIALDMDGIPIDDYMWPANGLLVVGEEGQGLGDGNGGRKFTKRIRIPTQNVESLNVVVAASIALSHKAARK